MKLAQRLDVLARIDLVTLDTEAKKGIFRKKIANNEGGKNV